MPSGTASYRLVKDLLWKFITEAGEDICCKCKQPMSRETFSIEHLTPWMDSEDPRKLFFDLENVNFSHRACNRKDTRIRHKKYANREERVRAMRARERETKVYDPVKRKEQYARTGK